MARFAAAAEAGARRPRCFFPSCGVDERGDDLRELVEDLAEACGRAFLLFLGGGGVVAREGQFGLAVAVVVEQHFVGVAFAVLVGEAVAGGAHAIAVGVGEVPEPDDLFQGDDLAKFAAVVEDVTIGSAHRVGEAAADAQIDAADRRSEAFRAPPFHDVLGGCPCLPDERAWGVEDAAE